MILISNKTLSISLSSSQLTIDGGHGDEGFRRYTITMEDVVELRDLCEDWLENHQTYNSHRERHIELTTTLESLTELLGDTFTMAARPNSYFRLNHRASYHNGETPIIVVDIRYNGQWLNYSKGTPAEIRKAAGK